AGPTWLFDIDSLSGTMNYHPVSVANQTNSGAGFQDSFDAEKAGEEVTQTYVLFPAWSAGSTNPQENDKDALVDGKEHGVDIQKSVSADIHFSSSSAQTKKQADKTEREDKAIRPTYENSSFKDASTSSYDPDMIALEDFTYSDDEAAVADERQVSDEFYGRTHILFRSSGKSASTPIDAEKPLLKDPDGDDVDVHTYRVFNSPMLYLLRVEMVLNSPWMLSKNWLVQKQMTLGKDSSNPLTVDSLLKTIWFSIHNHLTNEVLAIPGLTTTGQKFNFSKYIFDSLVKNVDSSTKFYMYPRDDVEADIGEEQIPDDTAIVAAQEVVTTAVLEDVLVHSIPLPAPPTPPPQLSQDIRSTSQAQSPPQQPQSLTLAQPQEAQTLEITQLKKRVKQLERVNKVKTFKLRRLKKVRTSQRVKTSDDTIMED
nr:hypothetical protein [Tanacetum cinerariifolium]